MNANGSLTAGRGAPEHESTVTPQQESLKMVLHDHGPTQNLTEIRERAWNDKFIKKNSHGKKYNK